MNKRSIGSRRLVILIVQVVQIVLATLVTTNSGKWFGEAGSMKSTCHGNNLAGKIKILNR